MKNRILKTAVLMLAVITLLLLVSACEEEKGPLDGIYACVAADTGEVYTFSGNKVNVKLYLMGSVAVDYNGTYEIRDGMIIFDFPKDTDNIYTGQQTVEILEDGAFLRIGDVTFTAGDPKINVKS